MRSEAGGDVSSAACARKSDHTYTGAVNFGARRGTNARRVAHGHAVAPVRAVPSSIALNWLMTPVAPASSLWHWRRANRSARSNSASMESILSRALSRRPFSHAGPATCRGFDALRHALHHPTRGERFASHGGNSHPRLASAHRTPCRVYPLLNGEAPWRTFEGRRRSERSFLGVSHHVVAVRAECAHVNTTR